MRLPAILAALLLFTGTLHAQTADPPAAEADPALTEGKHMAELLVIGDAIGGGLGAGLTRVAEPGGNYEVSLRFNEESGLARPEVYDWAATVPKILEGGQYDDIVVMLGANDRQTIRDQDQRLDFGSDAWRSAYKKQIDLLLDQLQASGAQILWVSPPPMKDPDYDTAMKLISDLQRERVEARGWRFLDIRPALSSADGSFTDVMKGDAGATTKLRGRDGISFFKAGNNLMGQLVLAALEKQADAPQPARPEISNSATKTDSEQPERQVPLFGQALMDQAPYTVQPEGVTANAMLIASGGLDPAAALKTLRDLARDGSGAASLFKRGQPATAPAGRADDFTAPVPLPVP